MLKKPEKRGCEDLHDTLKKVYESKMMDDEGRKIYETTKEHYIKRDQAWHNEMKARIAGTDATPEAKKKLTDFLREKFESSRVKGDFPLGPLRGPMGGG